MRDRANRQFCLPPPSMDFISFHVCYCCRFTACLAFKSLMNEINDLAGQHELVAEDLQAIVIKELTALVKDLKEERKVSLKSQ